MKKEFKTPVIETKMLTAQDDVMAGIMLTSAGQNPSGLSSMLDQTTSGYNQWKGFKAEQD